MPDASCPAASEWVLGRSQCEPDCYTSERVLDSRKVRRVGFDALATDSSRRRLLDARARQPTLRRDGVEGPNRVLLCIGGVVSRGMRFAWPIVDRRLVRHLRAFGHSVDVYGFHVDMGADTRVDGVPVDERDIAVVPFHTLEVANVSDIDRAIDARCRRGSCPRFTQGFHSRKRVAGEAYQGYSFVGQNAVRQLVSENRVGEFLLSPRALSRYAVAVVWWAGFYPWLLEDEWSLAAEVQRAMRHPRGVVLEQSPLVGRWGPRGQDGFYVGPLRPLSMLLRRWSDEAFWDTSTYTAGAPIICAHTAPSQTSTGYCAPWRSLVPNSSSCV